MGLEAPSSDSDIVLLRMELAVESFDVCVTRCLSRCRKLWNSLLHKSHFRGFGSEPAFDEGSGDFDSSITETFGSRCTTTLLLLLCCLTAPGNGEFEFDVISTSTILESITSVSMSSSLEPMSGTVITVFGCA